MESGVQGKREEAACLVRALGRVLLVRPCLCDFLLLCSDWGRKCGGEEEIRECVLSNVFKAV